MSNSTISATSQQSFFSKAIKGFAYIIGCFLFGSQQLAEGIAYWLSDLSGNVEECPTLEDIGRGFVTVLCMLAPPIILAVLGANISNLMVALPILDHLHLVISWHWMVLGTLLTPFLACLGWLAWNNPNSCSD